MSDFITNRGSYFPADVVKAAQTAEHQTGCPASVSLAQWAVESDYGKSAPGFNPFGMKWSPSCGYPKHTLRTEEFYGGAYHPVTADFIVFPSIAAAFVAHGHYLMGPSAWPEYQAAAKLWRTARDWEGFIRTMAPRYATSPTYADTLIGVVKQYELQDFNLPAGEA